MFKLKSINILLVYFSWIAVRHALVDPLKDPFYVASIFSKGGQFIEPGIVLFMMLYSFKKTRINKKYAVLYIGALLSAAVFIFSLLINRPLDLLNAVMFFFGYYAYIGLLLFIIAFSDDTVAVLTLLLKWYIVFLLFQFLMNLGWYLKISPFRNDYRFWEDSVDWAFGTLMGCVESAGISSIAVFCALYLLLYKPEIKKRLSSAGVLFFVGFLQIYWADSKLSYLSIAASTTVFISVLSPKSLFSKIRAFIIGVVSVFMLFYLSNYINEKSFPLYGSAFNRMAAVVGDGYGYLINDNAKMNVYRIITTKVSDKFPYNIFGRGPGNFTSRFAQKKPSSFTKEYWEPEYEKAQAITNSVIFNPQTAFLSLLGDVGWAGVFLYYSLSALLLTGVCVNLKRKVYSENWKIEMLAFSYCLYGGYFILHSFIDDNNYMGIQQGYFWVAGALLFRIDANKPVGFVNR